MEHESMPFGRGLSRIDSPHDEVEHWLMIRLGAPLPEPPGRSQRGPRLDAADMMMRSPPADAIDLTGIAVRILYVDADEQASERTIRCSKAWRASTGAILTAFCLLRLEPRSFRVSRIREVVDLSTGEITEGSMLFRDLGLDEWDSPLLVYLDAARRGLKVLMAVAAADGRVYSDEIEAVARWADRLADLHDIALDDGTLNRILRAARNMRPDGASAAAALRAALSTPAEARLLARAIQDIIKADDHVCREEIALVELLKTAAKP